jgi:hypothetical protein
MTEIQIKHRVLRSIGAVLAGMLVGIVLFTPWGQS